MLGMHGRVGVARTTSRVRTTGAALLGAALLALLAGAPGAEAAPRAFGAPLYSTNIKGNLAVAGNTFLRCLTTADGSGLADEATPEENERCLQSRAAFPPLPMTEGDLTFDNANPGMARIDVDGSGGMYMGTRATLALPAGTSAADIDRAFLTWSGTSDNARNTVPTPPGDRSQVTLDAQNAAPAQTFTDPNGVDSILEGGRDFFLGIVDATTYVKSAVEADGSTVFQAGNTQIGEGGNRSGGWSLYVIYKQASTTLKNISLNDGFIFLDGGSGPQDFTLSGFRTPPSGVVGAKVGFQGQDGDNFLNSNDNVFLNGTDTAHALTNDLNPLGNVLNSTISFEDNNGNASIVGGRQPNDQTTLSYDLDTLDADGLLNNNQTSTAARITTGDPITLEMVHFQIDLFEPKVTLTKSVADVNGGQVRPGDTLRYTIAAANGASADTATNMLLSDNVPAGTSFVPGSLRYETAARTDASDADNADVINNAGTARFGIGSLPVSTTRTMSFDVVVSPTATNGAVITNSCSAAFNSAEQPTVALSAPCNTVTSTVVVPPPDLTIDKNHTGTFTAGGTGSYTLDVSNVGGQPSSGAINVSDTAPAGISFGTPTAPNWNCAGSTAAQLSCTRADSVGPGAPLDRITIPVSVAPGAVGAITNRGTVGGGGDTNAANNFDDDVVTVARDFDVSVTKTRTSAATAFPGDRVTFDVVVTNIPGAGNSPTVDVADTLDPGLVNPAVTGACTTLACTVGPLVPGQSVTVTVAATLAAGTDNTTQTNRVAITPNAAGDRNTNNHNANASVTVAGRPDLTIAKDASVGTIAAGTGGTYTLAPGNVGSAATSGTITVTDTAPAGVAFGTPAGAGWNCAGSTASAITCSRGDARPAGQTIDPITVPFTTAPDQTGLRVNTALISGGGEVNTANNSDTADITLVRRFDARVAKSAAPTTLLPGESTLFTVTVTNAGPSVSDPTTLDEAFPAGLVLGNVTTSAGVTCNAAADCTIPSLAVGASATVQLQGTAPADVLTGSTQTNSVTIDPGANDTNSGNHRATVDVTVRGVPRIQARKRATSDQVRGSTATYEVDVANIGGVPTTAPTTITDPMPAGLSAVNAVGTGWDCSGTTPAQVNCVRLAGDAPGALPPITILVRVALDAPASITNRVTSNNCGPCPPPPPVITQTQDDFDLSIAKRVDVATVRAGDDVTYTLTVANAGPSNALGVSVDETLPAGIALKSATPSQGTCDQATGDCALGIVGPNGTVTITVVGTAQLAQRDTDQVNVATVAATNVTDRLRTNERATASVRIVAQDLQPEKTAEAKFVRGTDVAYEVTVTNRGSAIAIGGGGFDDAVPVGIQNPVGVGTGWTCTTVAQLVSCDRTNPADTLLPNVAWPVVRITGRVALNATTLSNSVTVRPGDPFDVPDVPFTPVVREPVSEVDVSIDKTASPETILATQRTTFTMVVRNAGPSIAEDVVMTDTLPAGFIVPDPEGDIVTSTKGTCSAGPAYSCDLGDMLPGTTETITIVAEAANARPPAETTVTNTATVATTTTELVPANNSDTADVKVDRTNDLLTVKTKVTDPVIAGDFVDFEILVTNNGPSDALDTRVEDVIPAVIDPATVTVTSSVPATCAVTADRTKVGCDIPRIDNGTAVLVTFRGKLFSDTFAKTLSNTACAINDKDPKTANNCSTTPDDDIEERSDVSVVKTGPKTVKADGQITYTLKVGNAGPSDAAETVLTDTLPEGSTLVSIDPACPVAGRVVTCAVGTLKPEETRTYTVVVDTQLQQAELTLTNKAQVKARPEDPNPGNDISTVETKVDASSNLSLVKTAPASVNAELPLVYTLTVRNAGPSTSQVTTVTDVLPGDVVLVTAGPSQGGCSISGQTLTCQLGPLAAGGVATILVTTTPAKSLSGITVKNRASVAGSNDDPGPGDNTSETDTLIKPPLPDLKVSKALRSGTPRVRETLSYRITVENVGNGPATDAVVTDTLPASLQFVSVKPSTGSCQGRQVVRCAVGTIPAKGRVFVDLEAKVVKTGELTNTAGASSAETDLNAADNVASNTQNGKALVNPVLRKLTGNRSARRGGAVPYTITFRNPGAGALRDVKLCDRMPAGMTFLKATPKPKLSGGQVCWTIKAIASGSSRSFKVTGRVDTDARGSRLTNRVSASGAGMKPVRAQATRPLQGVKSARANGVTG